MHKKLIMVVFIILATVLTVSAADENKGAEKITINGGSFGDIVDFPHHKHQVVLGDCNKCHDLFPKKANVIVEMKAEGKLKKKQVMNQCLDCHKAMKKANQKSGPVSCKQCHKK